MGTPGSGGGRTREQLLKLLESSAKKLKQFDKKYGEAKQQKETLQNRLKEKEAENLKLAQLLKASKEELDFVHQSKREVSSLAEAENQAKHQELEEKDEAIRDLSRELTALRGEHAQCLDKVAKLESAHLEVEEKLRAKESDLLAAEGEREGERRKVDDLLVKNQSLEAQILELQTKQENAAETNVVVSEELIAEEEAEAEAPAEEYEVTCAGDATIDVQQIKNILKEVNSLSSSGGNNKASKGAISSRVKASLVLADSVESVLSSEYENTRALQEKCENLSESEAQATEELAKRLETMQEHEKRLSYLNSQVDSLQAEVEVAAKRAQEAEEKVSELASAKERLERNVENLEKQHTNGVHEEEGEEKQKEKDGQDDDEEEQNAQKQEGTAEAAAALSTLQVEKEDIAAQLRLSKEMLEEANATNEKMKANVEELKKKFLATAKKKQGEFNAKMKSVKKMLDKQKEEIAALKKDSEAASAEASESAEGESTHLQNRITELEGYAEQVKIRELEVKDLQSKLSAAEAEIAEAKAAWEDHKARGEKSIEELKEKVQALSDQETQLKEANEAAKNEIVHLKKDKEEQKEAETQKKKKDLGQAKLKAVILELKRKLEKVEKLRQKEAKDLSNIESSLKSEMQKSQEVEQASSHEIQRLESELKTYKARAHILLQQKEDQLKNTVSTEMANTYKDKVSSLEEEIEELLGSRKQMEQAYTELQECHATEIKDLLENHKTEIAVKDENILEKNQEVKEIEDRLDQELGVQLEKLKETEKERDALQSKCSALEEEYQSDKATYQDIKDLHDTLEQEYKMYKQTAEELMQEKDKSISELSASLRDNKTLAMYKEAAKPIAVEDPRPAEITISAASRDDSPPEKIMPRKFSLENDLLGDITNSNIVEAAKLQASRDAFLDEYVQRIAELENEIQELQKEIAMREHLESVLKEELRKKEREEARSNLKGKDYDMEYLKNIVLKLLETGEYEVLLPVIATLLSLSPDEVERVKKAYKEGVHSQANDPMEYATKTASDVTSYLSGWMFSGGSSSK